MIRVEHVGIAVKNLENSISVYTKILDNCCYKTEEVESEKVKTAFFKSGETKVELLESTEPAGVIARFIERKGEGVHHIAFEVENIEDEMARLQQEGFTLINETAKKGADNKLVCFVHPKETNGVLIELCQEIK